ncbi:MAG: hypothetical protein JEZ06_11105 [Anaerolineaceae bacterium]|nr:hypothetical protein [Anaerolineaceae bacterium]
MRYYGLCSFEAVLDEIDENFLPVELPFGEFVSGLSTTLLFNGQTVDPIPEGAVLTTSFVVPQDLIGEDLAILHYDTLNFEWVEVPATFITEQVHIGGQFQQEQLNELFMGPQQLDIDRDTLVSYIAVENAPNARASVLNYQNGGGLPSECQVCEDCSFGMWYWDEEARDGEGMWQKMEVEFDENGDPIIDDHTEDDKLVVMNMPQEYSNVRMETSVNYTGAFVLVTR